MLLLIKTLIVLVWLIMFLLVVYAPKGSSSQGKDVILDVTSCAAGLEVLLNRKLARMPVNSRLLIIDDEKDCMRSRVIERLLIKNPGLVLKIDDQSSGQANILNI